MSLTPELKRIIIEKKYRLTLADVTTMNISSLTKGGLKVLPVCWHGQLKSENLARILVEMNIGAMYLYKGFENIVSMYERGILVESGLPKLLDPIPLIALIGGTFVTDVPLNITVMKKFRNLVNYPDVDDAMRSIQQQIVR